MKVGFFNVFKGTVAFQHTIHMVLADMMIRSVRKSMPRVPIIQFTDMVSPAIVGVDDIERRPSKPSAVLCVEHYAACEGDWLVVDTDVLIQKDVRHIFDSKFDVAVCDREGTMVPGEPGSDIMEEMKYNIGVVFSRNPGFWLEVLAEMNSIRPDQQEWMGNQVAACRVIYSNRYNIKTIPGGVYNRPPLNLKDRCEDACIIHFKGPKRKTMMLERFAEV